MATGDYNWLYGKNVIVWGLGHWRSDIALWLVNQFQCNVVKQVTNTSQIPDGPWVLLVRAEDFHIQHDLEAYGVKYNRGWTVRSSGEINSLAHLLAIGSIPVVPPSFVVVGSLSDDPDCGMF